MVLFSCVFPVIRKNWLTSLKIILIIQIMKRDFAEEESMKHEVLNQKKSECVSSGLTTHAKKKKKRLSKLAPVNGTFSGFKIGSNMPREWLLGFPALAGVTVECSEVRLVEALGWHTEKNHWLVSPVDLTTPVSAPEWLGGGGGVDKWQWEGLSGSTRIAQGLLANPKTFHRGKCPFWKPSSGGSFHPQMSCWQSPRISTLGLQGSGCSGKLA